MDDKRKSKIEQGSHLLDIYIKSKKPETPGRSDGRSTVAENTFEACSMSSDRNAQDHERNVLKLDSPTLKKKTDEFDSLSRKIKTLQDELSEKSERITALEIQNKILLKGSGDGGGVLPCDGGKETINELQKMVDARDTYIKQLSDSLQKRSEELQASIQREKELSEEVHNLQQQMNTLTKQTEMKLSESYSEGVEYKAKVEVMSKQVQEYSNLVQSLKVTLENNNKELITKKEELDAKEKKLERYKSDVSEDVKRLMRQIETLNCELSRKEKELINSKKEVEQWRGQLDEQFGSEIVALKAKLESKYAEDVKKVESLYDGMLLEHIRKSDEQLKAVHENTQIEDQVQSLRELYNKELNKYKEELEALLLKSKATENKLTCELEKYKEEADHYRQQVENLENKVAEEVRKVRHECFKELDKYESEMKQEQRRYEAELQQLGQKLKDCAIIEATKEVELESYKNELEKLTHCVSAYEEKFRRNNEEYERQKSQFVIQITQYKNNETSLMNDLGISRAKLLEYEHRAYEFNENMKDQSKEFSEKYKNVVRTFEEQIQNLMNELERMKANLEAEKSRYSSMVNEKENQIKNLEAKLNYLSISKSNQTNENNTTAELLSDQESIQEQINTLKKNLIMAETNGKSKTEDLYKILNRLKQVKAFISRMSSRDTEENTQDIDISCLENDIEKIDHDKVVVELEKTICDIMNMTQTIDVKSVLERSRMSNIYFSTPRVGDSTDRSSDPSCTRDDPDLVKKSELLEAENVKLTRKLEMLAAHMKEMEYFFYIASKENLLFDEKCKDLDAKITELETLKLSEFMLKKENNELKKRVQYIEESEKKVRKELAELVENNIKLEKTLTKSLVDLHKEVSNGGKNIKLEEVISDLEAKSEEVIRVRSQLSAVQGALKDNQEKMMLLRGQCDKFMAEHEYMMSEIETKQKELEDVWKERNELSTENKMLQSKLLSVQQRSSYHLHKIPCSVKSSSTSNCEADDTLVTDKESSTSKMTVPENDDDFSDFHLKRLRTMHLLTESIALSSKTNVRDSSSNFSVSSRIDLELKQLDEMFDEPDHHYMPTITEEDEDEVRVFFEHMARGDQNVEDKVDPK